MIKVRREREREEGSRFTPCHILGSEVISGSSVTVQDVPVMGFYQTPQESGGRIVVFGDSNCLDSAHLQRGMWSSPALQ